MLCVWHRFTRSHSENKDGREDPSGAFRCSGRPDRVRVLATRAGRELRESLELGEKEEKKKDKKKKKNKNLVLRPRTSILTTRIAKIQRRIQLTRYPQIDSETAEREDGGRERERRWIKMKKMSHGLIAFVILILLTAGHAKIHTADARVSQRDAGRASAYVKP